MGAILQTCVKHHVAEAATPPDLEIRIASVDRKSTRLNSSHLVISYAVFCLKKKKNMHTTIILLRTYNNLYNSFVTLLRSTSFSSSHFIFIKNLTFTTAYIILLFIAYSYYTC